MKMRALAAVAVAATILAGPAFAAGTTMAPAAAATTKAAPTAPATAKPAAKKVHYYIAQAVDTKACSVVAKKPDGKTATMVGKYWYASQAKANAAMKRAAACKGA